MNSKFIGEIQHRFENNPDLGRVRPILRLNEETRVWEAAPPSDFPNEGYVFWPRMDFRFEIGQFVQFGTQPNQLPTGSDRLVIISESASMAPVVIDYSSIETVGELWSSLRDGLHLPHPLSSGSYLWVLEDRLIPLLPSQNGRSDVVSLENIAGTLDAVPYFTLKTGWLYEGKSSNPIYLLLKPLQNHQPTGFLDLRHPDEVLKSVVAKLEDDEFSASLATLPAHDSAEALKRQIEQLWRSAELVSAIQYPGLWESRLERLRELLSNAANETRQIRRATDALLELPSIQVEVDRRVAASLEAYPNSRYSTTDVYEDDSNRLNDHSTVQAEFAAQREQLEANHRAEQNRLNEEIERLGEQVSQLIERRDDLELRCLELEEQQQLPSRQLMVTEQSQTTSLAQDGLTPWATSTKHALIIPNRRKVAAQDHLSWRELLAGITRIFAGSAAAARRGIRPLVATMAAKRVPALTGPYSHVAIEALAHQYSAGSRHIVSISPHTLHPRDLFHDPRANVSTGLSEYLHAARQDCLPGLVVLDGINRAPVESYLIPLLRWLAIQPGRRVDSLCQTNWENSEGLVWPTSVGLVVSLSEGPTTLPIPRTLWGLATLHCPDLSGLELDLERPVGSLSFNQNLIAEQPSSLSSLLEEVDSLADYPALDTEFGTVCTAAFEVETAMLWLEATESSAREFSVRSVLGPYLAGLARSSAGASILEELQALLGDDAVGLERQFEELSLLGLTP